MCPGTRLAGHTHAHLWMCLRRSTHVCSLSHISPFPAPWTVAHQAPLSMESSRQEYWSALPFSTPADLLKPGRDQPCVSWSSELAGGFFTTDKPISNFYLLSLFSVYSECFVLSPPRVMQAPGTHLSPGPSTGLISTLASGRSQRDFLETEIRLCHAFVQNPMVLSTTFSLSVA